MFIYEKIKKVLVISVIVLFVLLLGRLSLPFLDDFLVARDEPQHGDIIVVLMGSGPDRMLEAVELYQQGYSDEIVIVRNMVRGYDLAVSQGEKIPHNSDIIKEVAGAVGIPADRVTILPYDALSTQDEAIAVREYLENKRMQVL